MSPSGSTAPGESPILRVATLAGKENALMLSSHVDALQSKHAGLDARLERELARPAPDDAMIRDIKKQKLRLKEEIARL